MKNEEKLQQRRRMRRRKRRRQRALILVGAAVCLAFAVICPITLFLQNQREKNNTYCTAYESETFTQGLYQETLYASSLCVGTDKELDLTNGIYSDSFHAAALFDVENGRPLYARNMFDKLYPASTTKLLTAYVALKYGNLEDTVVVGRNATVFEPEAVLCGLMEGDRISLADLLGGLLLYSGNDNAVAIAEHISGSVEAFAELMNQEAWQLGATHTHFVNPHGLHDENHYTTAYDLYLIFNACLKDSRFVDFISAPNYTGTITDASGYVRHLTWTPTNHYTAGMHPSPDGIRVIGGKTGTTNEAGSCLIIYNVTSKSSDGREHPFITIIMGEDTKPDLYHDMDILLASAVTTAEENILGANVSPP